MILPYVKTVMITGASSGIGKATATLFAKRGYNVIITGRRAEKLNDLKAKLRRKYAIECHVLIFDVRNKKACKKAIESLSPEWHNIDILINNAGLAKGLAPINSGKIEDWETMIDTNVKGLLYMTRYISAHMVKQGHGHIINVCSTAGHEVYAKGNVYCATKYAVDALTKGMRLDLTALGIKVSQVSPGAVEETEFAITRFDGDAQKAKIYDDYNPLTSKDVADVIHYVATRPRHVNIHDVVVTGAQQASSTVIDRSGRIYDKR